MISIMDFFRFSGGILAGVVILGAILFSFSLPLFSLAIPVLGGLALWFLVIPFPELRTLSFLIFLDGLDWSDVWPLCDWFYCAD